MFWPPVTCSPPITARHEPMLQKRGTCLRHNGCTRRLSKLAGRLVGKQQVCRQSRLSTTTGAFLLRPTGDGTTGHLDGQSVPPLQSFLLTQGQFEVGRSAEASISIPIPTVSTRHALLLVGPYSDNVEGEMLLLTDLRSTNGTLVNGVEVEPLSVIELSPGAEVIFGDVHLAKFVVEKYEEEVEQAGEQTQAVAESEAQPGSTAMQQTALGIQQQQHAPAGMQANSVPLAEQQPVAIMGDGQAAPLQAGRRTMPLDDDWAASPAIDDDWAAPAVEDDWASTGTAASPDWGAAEAQTSTVAAGSAPLMGDEEQSDGQAAGYGYVGAAQNPTAEQLGAQAAAGGFSMVEDLVQAAATGQDLMQTLSTKSFDDDDHQEPGAAGLQEGKRHALFAQNFKHVHDTSDEEDYAAMRLGLEVVRQQEEKSARLAVELEQVASLQQQQKP